MKALILTLCLCVLVMEVYSSCMVIGTNQPRADGSCIYKRRRFRNGQTKRLGRKCLECTCNGGTLSCCGFGHNAGAIGAPVGCVLDRSARCSVIHFVKENNRSETCADS